MSLGPGICHSTGSYAGASLPQRPTLSNDTDSSEPQQGIPQISELLPSTDTS
jgi:hypothetical protein